MSYKCLEMSYYILGPMDNDFYIFSYYPLSAKNTEVNYVK